MSVGYLWLMFKHISFKVMFSSRKIKYTHSPKMDKFVYKTQNLTIIHKAFITLELQKQVMTFKAYQ